MRSGVGGLVLLLVLGAAGCAGQARKAEKALESFRDGKVDRLQDAVEHTDKAVDRDPEDVQAWVLRGQVNLELAEHPPAMAMDLPKRDFPAAALESFEKAAALGASGGLHGTIAEDVPRLESLLVAVLTNAVEAREWDEADVRLDQALRARALDEKLRGDHPERAQIVERLAVQVAAGKRDTAAAQRHYKAYAAAAGADDSPLAVLVARTLADTGDIPGALAFLEPLSEARGADDALLKVEVELLVESGQATRALARIGQALPALERTVGGLLLAADLYEAAGAPELAQGCLERAVALDPTNVTARTELGRSLLAEAVAARAEIAARDEELDQRRPPKDLLALVKGLPVLWLRAEENLLAATTADPRSREAVAALVALYEARIGDAEAETVTAAERPQLEADQKKLEAAREALAGLGGEG